MSWHVDAPLLRRYRAHQLTDSQSASVEMHVTSCPACRDLVTAEAGGEPASRTAARRVKLAVDERLDAAPTGWAAAALRRIRINDRDAGLLAAALSLHGSWLAAAVVAMAFGVLAASARAEGAGLAVFLAAAPVVPVAGVALAYGPRVDPTYEIAVAAPVPAIRVVLLRALAVTLPALPLLVLLSVALPGGMLPFAWLLPSAGLAAASLALGTLVPVPNAAAVVGTGWAVAVAASLAGAPQPAAEAFVRGFAAFRPSGQMLSAVLAVASFAFVARRRAAFETGR